MILPPFIVKSPELSILIRSAALVLNLMFLAPTCSITNPLPSNNLNQAGSSTPVLCITKPWSDEAEPSRVSLPAALGEVVPIATLPEEPCNKNFVLLLIFKETFCPALAFTEVAPVLF